MRSGDGACAVRRIGVPPGLTVAFDPAGGDVGAAYPVDALSLEVEPVK